MKVMRGRPIVLGVLLVAVCAVAGLTLGVNAKASSTSGDSAEAAPEWLQAKATTALTQFTGEQTVSTAVTSLTWVKTTWNQYEKAIDGPPGNDNAAYVVVARGDFTSDLAAGDAEPIHGTVVILTYDAASTEPSTMDVLYTDETFDEGIMGQPSTMALSK